MFYKGDLKYVILDLLKDKPSHGYEIIRELESRFQGFYTPSAGSVYPTLQMLEDMGYVQSAEQDGKKIYTITEEGRKFLAEQTGAIDKIKEQMEDWWNFEGRQDIQDIYEDLRRIGFSIRAEARRMAPEKLVKIKDIIGKSFNDIEKVIRE
jgi:DNA-binding PadR family transcriptional regulator